MDYIRRVYGVPAEVGGIIEYEGKRGAIVGARDGRLRILLDGENVVRSFHPKWHLVYITPPGGDE